MFYSCERLILLHKFECFNIAFCFTMQWVKMMIYDINEKCYLQTQWLTDWLKDHGLLFRKKKILPRTMNLFELLPLQTAAPHHWVTGTVWYEIETWESRMWGKYHILWAGKVPGVVGVSNVDVSGVRLISLLSLSLVTVQYQ